MPGFDPKTMTDAELISKSDDLMRRLNWTSRFSVGGQAVDQLRAMLSALEIERRERQFMENWDMMQKYIGGNIETDVDIKALEKEEQEKINPTPVAKPRPRMVVRRVIPTPTLHPVLPSTTNEHDVPIEPEVITEKEPKQDKQPGIKNSKEV